MTEEQRKELEALAKKNPLVAVILQEYKVFVESPYVNSYLTLLNQIEDWNEQLKIRQVETTDGESETEGRINLFSDKDSKEFDRAFKYFGEMLALHKSLDALRSLMTNEQQKEVQNKKSSKNMSVAV